MLFVMRCIIVISEIQPGEINNPEKTATNSPVKRRGKNYYNYLYLLLYMYKIYNL